MPGNILAFILIGLWLLAFAVGAVKRIRNRYAPVKSVKAVVADK